MISKTALQLHHHVGRSRQPVDAPAEPENIRHTVLWANKSRHPGVNHPVTLTTSLGRFIANLSPDRLPGEAASIALAGLTDSIATMVAGRDKDAVRFLTETLAPADGLATATFGAPDYHDDARDLTARL
jgi:hypothetical protein